MTRLSPLPDAVGPQERHLAAGLASLRGITVGLLDNGKPYADRFLGELGRHLRERYGVADVITASKPNAWAAAESEVLSRLRASQAVVTAFAD